VAAQRRIREGACEVTQDGLFAGGEWVDERLPRAVVTEIAAELYLSINTVKTHQRAVYRKLAATNRRDAVRRARKLNLL
jgi:hypothetical protein